MSQTIASLFIKFIAFAGIGLLGAALAPSGMAWPAGIIAVVAALIATRGMHMDAHTTARSLQTR